MSDSEVDWNHPAIREYLALVRLQVLTPLSLLISIATFIICSVVANPSIGKVSRLYPTSISPRPDVIAVYIIAVYAGQLGYCILLVISRKPETKKTVTQGVGYSLVLANWLMAIWAITWVFEAFIAATVFQGLLLLFLIYANLVLLIYHSPTYKRPFDLALIHAPIRFFLVLEIMLMFPLSLFLALGLYSTSGHGGVPSNFTGNPWPGFGVLLATNVLGLVVVVTRRDSVWTLAATWVNVSIWSLRPKPAPVYITAIIFTAILPLGLIASIVYSFFGGKKDEGHVALPEDGDHPGLYGNNGAQNSAQRDQENNRGPRQVDEEEVWG